MKKANNLRVPYGQAVHGEEEKKAIIRVLDEHRTITGKETERFEERVSKIFGKKFGIAVNSGSSANLLAVRLLNLAKGSEVITPLLTFSTTVSPIIQNDLVPVFVDVKVGTYQIDVGQIEKNITKKTKALMIPSLIGNVPDLKRIKQIAKKHKLFFIEDSCDTLGATFEGKPSGYYSDISTISFYGSHIITAGGNGGMLMVNSKQWRDRAKVLRGWGRTSSIFSESESLDKRFSRKINGIQYDGKFIFDAIGYNFMPMELGFAFGNVQLDKLDKFKKIREKNFNSLLSFLKGYENFFALPNQDPRVRTQWLAFALTIKEGAPFKRLEIVTFLEQNNIQTRPIFTGNILLQPGFKNINAKANGNYPNTNNIMKNSFLVGCHHGLNKQQIDKLKEVFTIFLKKYA
ncbi:MAG: NDP-hexose 3,4-dehydratase [Candidatus Woesebacteria bacterium GW2011_GWB1_39_10]|uniref:NDP-hexose 3,4-dehydratase n=2 Tax=Candidatus Woeseibacteriota TaxID=1752722 RepID=A0A0G0XSU5_9BACT|nr:MAG: NDP-hexose 3,4-dehydratase [Candidatus Woesebacteria bacterium GW2011_GWB1_39_10]KKR90987.1 MAG: NDP-hexose 3,4-dehydratase [Candidatus Woesebacteria bacterium GW2011_GWA1_41_13b]